jgi:hypothetical protein
VQVGVELGYLSAQYKALGMDSNAFLELMATIPYRLYPLLAIFAALMVCSPEVLTWLRLTEVVFVHRRLLEANELFRARDRTAQRMLCNCSWPL